ncbi:MAG: hypothetical protein JWN48_4859 [Myxococcaceae bacterium]|nr:hypothetical protein [Myxococcaceae bacterium]
MLDGWTLTHTLGVRCALHIALVLTIACGSDGHGTGGSPNGQLPDGPGMDAGKRLLDASMSTGEPPLPPDPAHPVRDAGAPPLPDSSVDPTAALYPPGAILDVQIDLAASDWSKLTAEGHTLAEIFSGCQGGSFEYQKYPARVRVNGQEFAQVGVRKKGFLGSLSTRKPSLRLDFDEYVSSQTVQGAKALTLNNGVQDPSAIKQCLAYQVLNLGGIASPRCGYARVTVNGVPLGIYSNVEPIKKPFLRRVFGEAEGNLYEGSVPADFRPDLSINFEKKTNESELATPELDAISAALLETDESKLLAALDRVIDLDQYARFWAAEVLIADWDSYDGNQNNFYLYGHPATGKVSFIPWGVDSAFDTSPWTGQGLPLSALANSRLSNRLYRIDAAREQYRLVLRGLLQQWDETVLAAEIDRMAMLVAPSADPGALDALRSFVKSRRAALQAELDAPFVPWPHAANFEGSTIGCHAERSTPVRGSFRTTWLDDESGINTPGNTLDGTFEGQPVPTPVRAFSSASSVGGVSALPTSGVRSTFVLPDGRTLIVQFLIGRDALSVGDVPTHGLETYGEVLVRPAQGAPDAAPRSLGYISKATLHFSQAGSTKGAPIVGSYEGVFTTEAE